MLTIPLASRNCERLVKGIENPEREVGDASTKKEREAIMIVAERYIMSVKLSVGNLVGAQIYKC